MQLIAHRGLHGPPPAPPENTVASLAAAVASPVVTGVEFDVRVLGDGTLVVFHDPDLFRLTALPHTLARLDLAAWAHFRTVDGTPLATAADTLPTLRAALQRPDFHLHVEIKPHPRLEPALPSLRAFLAALGAPRDRLTVSSFDPRFIAALASAPDAPGLALIVHQPAALDALAFLPTRAIAVHADDAFVRTRPELLARWRAEDRPVRIWTIDDPAVAAHYAALPPAMRPDALITNTPAALADALGPAEPFAPTEL
jgi:glycerophosphoryl diester phosphodiesterase